MLHPTQNHTYQGEMERKKIHIYMFPLLLILVRTFQLKQKWFFFRIEMLRQAEMERKNIHIYMYPFTSA